MKPPNTRTYPRLRHIQVTLLTNLSLSHAAQVVVVKYHGIILSSFIIGFHHRKALRSSGSSILRKWIPPAGDLERKTRFFKALLRQLEDDLLNNEGDYYTRVY